MGQEWSHFSSEVHIDTPAKAREKILSEYGSRHHVLRRYIKIEKVEEVKQKDDAHGR